MTLDVDGGNGDNCVCENGTIVYAGGSVRLVSNACRNCRWMFTDAALRTLSLLRGLHAEAPAGSDSQVARFRS